MGRAVRRRWFGYVGTAVLVTSSIITVADPRVALAVEAADVAAMADGLESLANSLTQLPSVESLADKIPFAGVSPADLLDVQPLLAALQAQLNAFVGTTASDLDSFLDDPDGANGAANDGTIAGVRSMCRER